MARSVFVVKSNPVRGREDEYNDWYNNQHLADVLAVPGFVSARRFVLADLESNTAAGHRYLALYEIDGDPADGLAALKSAAPGMHISEAMAPGSESFVYTEIQAGRS